MNIFTYWENPQGSQGYWYINQCIELMRQKLIGSNFTLLTPDNLHHYVDMSVLPDHWKTLEVAKKADCIRAVALLQNGGWWLDADTIVIKPFELLQGKSPVFMTWRKPPRRVINGYFYCPQGHQVAVNWVNNIRTALEQQNRNWTAFGEQSLTPAIEQCSEAVEIELATFLPVEVDANVRIFISRWGNWRKFIKEHTVCFGLNHSWLNHNFPNQMTEQAFRSGQLFIHRLFRSLVLEELEK